MNKILYLFVVIHCIYGITCVPTPNDVAQYCEYKGVRIKEGDTDAAPVGECGTMKCENATTGLLSGLGCGTVSVGVSNRGPRCYVKDGDKNKRYPDCCETVECEDVVEPEHCNYKGILIKEGELVPAPVGECQSIACGNARYGVILSRGCNHVTLNPNCKVIEGDSNKPYPACCDSIQCEGGEKN